MAITHVNSTPLKEDRLPFASPNAPRTAHAPQPSATHALPRRARRNFEPEMIVIFALIFVTALAIFATLRLGADYYLTALAERPQHPQHELFKASGVIGQGLGILGGLFCMLTLLYPLRKRWRVLENLGTPRAWFQFHVYFGIAGPLFATLHTTLKFGGLASVSYWSMMIVMASGFIGRFLFALVPRNQRGVALSIQELDAELRAVQQFLAAQNVPDLGLSLPHAQFNVSRSGGCALFTLWWARRKKMRTWNLHLRTQSLPASTARRISSILARKFFLESSRVTLATTARAFSYWHALHLPFTVLMFVTLLLHIGLAILFGYTWIL